MSEGKNSNKMMSDRSTGLKKKRMEAVIYLCDNIMFAQ